MGTLDAKWNGVVIAHTAHPVYLSVTQDRTLSYKKHVMKTKAKISARNFIIISIVTKKLQMGSMSNKQRSESLHLHYATL